MDVHAVALALEVEPAGHAAHTLALATEKVPALHWVQAATEVMPTPELNVPATQAEQEDAVVRPSTVPYLPALQPEHAEAPDPVMYVPTGHELHGMDVTAMPVIGTYPYGL